MRRALLVLASLLAAVAAAAEGLVPPEEFEAMSEGRTLHFALQGAPFGSEQFLAGRRSVWRFADGACQRGRWEPRGERICFRYEGEPAPICWLFRREGGGFSAHLVEGGQEVGFSLDLTGVEDAPLPCPGPWIGS